VGGELKEAIDPKRIWLSPLPRRRPDASSSRRALSSFSIPTIQHSPAQLRPVAFDFPQPATPTDETEDGPSQASGPILCSAYGP